MKNKEIEELLNKFKNADSQQFNELVEDFDNVYKLLSYIEQLENLCNKYEQEHKTTFEIWKKDIKKLEQLENNRDKAIEYLKEKADYPISYYHCIREAIDILKGGSDD